MKQPNYVRQAVKVIRARLDPMDAGHAAANEVTTALMQIRPYLDTHVLPLLEQIENGADKWQRDRIALDSAHVTARRARKIK